MSLRARARMADLASGSERLRPKAIPEKREINRGIDAKARIAIPAFAACGQLDLRGRLQTAQYSEIEPASASFAVLELS